MARPTVDSMGKPLVLYRATVTPMVTAHSAERSYEEVAVFFEAPRDKRVTALDALLHFAWCVDVSTLVITCSSERELLEDDAIGPESDGDVRLFEDGYSPTEIYYLDPACTQFFVRPKTQARLQRAQAIANQRRLERHARLAFDVAHRASTRQWAASESEAQP